MVSVWVGSTNLLRYGDARIVLNFVRPGLHDGEEYDDEIDDAFKVEIVLEQGSQLQHGGDKYEVEEEVKPIRVQILGWLSPEAQLPRRLSPLEHARWRRHCRGTPALLLLYLLCHGARPPPRFAVGFNEGGEERGGQIGARGGGGGGGVRVILHDLEVDWCLANRHSRDSDRVWAQKCVRRYHS